MYVLLDSIAQTQPSQTYRLHVPLGTTAHKDLYYLRNVLLGNINLKCSSQHALIVPLDSTVHNQTHLMPIYARRDITVLQKLLLLLHVLLEHTIHYLGRLKHQNASIVEKVIIVRRLD